MNENVFLAYWSSEGFESIIDITEYKHAEIMAALDAPGAKEKTKELNQMLSGMEMRARMNPQRDYECYVVSAKPEITHDDLWDMATTSPQAAVDIFRSSGVKVFSYKQSNKRVIE